MLVTSLPVGTRVVVNGHELFKITDANRKNVTLSWDLPDGWRVWTRGTDGALVVTTGEAK